MPGRILVPLDGRREARPCSRQWRRPRGRGGPPFHLLHVAPPVGADGRIVAYADQDAARVVHRVRTYLMTAAAGLPDMEVEVAVRFVNPVGEILDDAESAGIDLIAMATHPANRASTAAR